MSEDKKRTLEKLKIQIAERISLIKSIAEKTWEIVHGLGALIERRQGDYNTEVKWELKEFSGFRILLHLGQTMFGGNDIYIWYQSKPIFWIYFQSDIGECRVREFVPGYHWKIFDKIFSDLGKHVASAREAEEKKAKEESEDRDLTRQLLYCKKEAERLGLIK